MNEKHAGRKRKVTHDGDYHKEIHEEDKKNSKIQSGLDDIQLTPPRHLSGYGRALWKVLAPELRKLNKVKQLDRTSLELFCSEYGHYRSAEEKLEEYGEYISNDDGIPVKRSPALVTVETAARTMKSLGADLGLSFNARSGQVLAETHDDEDDSAKSTPLKVVKFSV